MEQALLLYIQEPATSQNTVALTQSKYVLIKIKIWVGAFGEREMGKLRTLTLTACRVPATAAQRVSPQKLENQQSFTSWQRMKACHHVCLELLASSFQCFPRDLSLSGCPIASCHLSQILISLWLRVELQINLDE